jgi:hypothetical protein
MAITLLSQGLIYIQESFAETPRSRPHSGF